MKSYYCDSSALVKLYIPETGSLWMDQLVSAQTPDGTRLHTVTTAKIVIVEVAAAIARHERMGTINSMQRKVIYKSFLKDSKQWLLSMPINEEHIYMAAELTQKYPLRGYDAVHLASALALNRMLTANQLPSVNFVSTDEKLCQAAQTEGLATEKPNQYQ